MNMPRLEDKEILSKERDSPHERTTRQVRTDIGESDQHLSYTNKESLCLRSWQAAFLICGLTGQKSPLSGLPLDLCLA